MNLLMFILISFGLTQILVSGAIFNRIRPNKPFFRCPMCIGFWVGVFLFIINGFTSIYSFELTFINGFLLGCLSSGTSYVLCQLFDDNGFKIKFKK